MKQLLSLLVILTVNGSAQISRDFEKLATGTFEPATFEHQDSTLNYLIRIPEEAGSKKLPLILFLHGAGERGDDNQSQLKHNPFSLAPEGTFKKNPCLVIAPQCPKEQWWSGDNLKTLIKLVGEITDHLPVDKNRIYITGLSMGGMGTWALLDMEPKLFAAAVPICGRGNPQKAKNIKHIPIWAFHGDADTTVTPDGTREMVAALKEAGSEVKYTEYPGVKHDSWTQTYKQAELWEWLFAQKK